MARKFFSKLFAISGLVAAALAVLFSFIVLNTTDKIGLTVSVIWMALTYPAQVLSMIIHGDIHMTGGSDYYIGVAVEWFLIGYFVVRFFHNWIKAEPPAPPTKPGDAAGGTSQVKG
jgi:hypothetical protein